MAYYSSLNFFVVFQNKFKSFKSWAYRKGVDTAVTRLIAVPFVTTFTPKACLLILGASYVLVNTITTPTTSEYVSPVIECLASYTIVYRNLDLICEYTVPMVKTVSTNAYPIVKAAASSAIPVLKVAVQNAFPLTKGIVETAIKN